jgi:hypothetical protein
MTIKMDYPDLFRKWTIDDLERLVRDGYKECFLGLKIIKSEEKRDDLPEV